MINYPQEQLSQSREHLLMLEELLPAPLAGSLCTSSASCGPTSDPAVLGFSLFTDRDYPVIGAFIQLLRRRNCSAQSSGTLPREQWKVFIPNAHPGYISLEEFEAIAHDNRPGTSGEFVKEFRMAGAVKIETAGRYAGLSGGSKFEGKRRRHRCIARWRAPAGGR
jgi:hypothetical protein